MRRPRESWEVPYRSVKMKKLIAEGSFGAVWKAKWYNIFVAAKVVRADVALSDEVASRFLAEIRLTRWCWPPGGCLHRPDGTVLSVEQHAL